MLEMVQHQYLVYIKILGFKYNEKFIIITQNSSFIYISHH